MSSQRIIGIDPGSRITGVGIIDSDGRHNRCVYHGAIKMATAPLPDRLGEIFQGVSALIELYQPTQMAIEDVFVAKNPSSALKLGQARGAAICAGIVNKLTVAEYSAREVKLAVVGKGSAEKTQVQHMIRILLNIQGKLQADAADGLGVAICHAHHRDFKQRIMKQSTL